jgi:hypothetical protein
MLCIYEYIHTLGVSTDVSCHVIQGRSEIKAVLVEEGEEKFRRIRKRNSERREPW